jgi:hypothetical protein
MPCSEKFIKVSRNHFFLHYLLSIKSGIGPLWPVIRRELKILRQKCENNIATIADLKVIVLNFHLNFNK